MRRCDLKVEKGGSNICSAFVSGISEPIYLQLLPSSTRAALTPLQCSYEQIPGGSNTSKARGTLLTRQWHYLDWCDEYEVDPIPRNEEIEDRNQVMALCAFYLAQGNAILATSIKEDTISRHLAAAASLSTYVRLADPRCNLDQQITEGIAKVLREQKRWETVPNRQEPATPAMVECMPELCNSQSMDSSEYALYDSNVLGQVCGFRLNE